MAQLNNQEGWQSCTSNHKNCSPVNFESHLIKVRATRIGLRHFATWRRSPWVGWALVSLLRHLSSTACLLDVSFPNLNLVPSIIEQSSDSRPIRISWVPTKFVLLVNGVEDTLGVKSWGTSMTYSPYRTETQKELGQGHSQVQDCIVGISPTHRPNNLGENS
jgi:hypothetical protein